MLIETGLQQHLARQKLAALREAGLNAVLAPGSPGPGWSISLEPGPATERLAQALAALDHCHEIILDAAKRADLQILPYKARDSADLAAAITRAWRRAQGGWPGAAAMWHELVWAQGFPNGNHRTASLYVESLLSPPGRPLRDLAADLAGLEELFRASKRLVQEKEFAPNPAAAKEAHRRLTDAFFAKRFNPEDAR